MFCPRSRGKKSEVQTEEIKAQLLQVARKHFAMHGYQGASLKEIAKEARVAGSLINYHFTGKEELFRACTETFARARMEAINRILAEPQSREDVRVRLQIFVEEVIVSMSEDPYSFDIMEREMKAGNERILALFHDTLLQSFKNVVTFFSQAKTKGLLKPGVEPLCVSILLFNAACDSARKDLLLQKFYGLSLTQVEWRKKFVDHIVNLFMNGVML